jgi:Flp pilus assembly secretin CpaC
MRVHLRRGGFIVATLAALSVAGPAIAADDPIDVTIDFAKVVKITKPADTIIVGNSGIADATVGDDQTLVLTGKTAGTTNLIVLDQSGGEIMNVVLRVSSDIRQLTTVFYGSSRQTYSCSPVCEQVISVGDSKEQFETATAQINTRKDFLLGK